MYTRTVTLDHSTEKFQIVLQTKQLQLQVVLTEILNGRVHYFCPKQLLLKRENE